MDTSVVLEDNITLKSWKILAKNHTFLCFSEEAEKEWRGPFFFIQGADPQFGLIERYLEKKANPGWSQEVALAENAISKINAIRPRPAFFVVCGDLCDAMPGEEPETYRKQELAFKQVFQKLDPEIPLVCVCGNHDVGDHPSRKTVEIYRSSFGDDYFSFWCRGILFLVVNSQYWCDPSGVKELAEEHDEWLNKQLAAAKKAAARIIVFQHVPWFLKEASENVKPSYFTIEPHIRGPWLDKLVDHGVEAVFCGHLHRNAGGTYKGMEIVVTSAIGAQLGTDKSGLRVVKVLDTSLSHIYFPLEDVPSVVSV